MASGSVVAKSGAGAHYSIGQTKFEVRADTASLGGDFALMEFAGGEGPWTVPHVHRHGRESFYVLDGRFTFRIGDEEHPASPGDFVSVAPGTVHMIRAGANGGRLLALVPAKLEAMFVEMSGLGPEALTDPATRADLARRHDSVPS